VSIDTTAPAPPAGAGSAPPSLPGAGIPPLPGAGIAAALDGGELFTELAELLSGQEISFHADGNPRVYSLTPADRGPLRAQPGVQGIRRCGILRTSRGRDIARVTAVYLPNRIPSERALRELHMTNAPLGQVLAPLGAIRQSLGAMVIADGDIAVRARGLLSIGGVPVALAEEQVLRSFAVRP
jgi:hypothetical protein